MLGSIEELEKDIELFQKNIAASSELQMLMKQILEQINRQSLDFETHSLALISRVESLPSSIENANDLSNKNIKNDVAAELETALKSFNCEQEKIIQAMEDTKKKMEICAEQICAQEKSFSDEVTATLTKFNESIKLMIDENEKANAKLKADIDNLLEERNAVFSKEQGRYIESMQQTQNSVMNCEKKLDQKYSEFIDTLQKMNVYELYNKNVQIQRELNKRTTILMIISAVSVVIGIIGIVI